MNPTTVIHIELILTKVQSMKDVWLVKMAQQRRGVIEAIDFCTNVTIFVVSTKIVRVLPNRKMINFQIGSEVISKIISYITAQGPVYKF